MLVSMKEILKYAEAKGTSLGAFNTPNMTSLRGVLAAAEALNEPVIIMHAQVHEEMGLCKMEEIAPVMLALADMAKVPVCVHLDHGTDLDYIKHGLELGFTSVMYDGACHNEALNTANTCIAREMSLRYGASLEAEIGSMGSREGGVADDDESIYTDPDVAKRFVENTGIDALACAFGTVHGVYLKTPKLDFDRLERINSLVDVPLVMHGGSGVSVENYKKVIARGIRKINYYTYMAKAAGNAVAALEDKTYFHNIELAAIAAVKDDVTAAMKVFGNLE